MFFSSHAKVMQVTLLQDIQMMMIRVIRREKTVAVKHCLQPESRMILQLMVMLQVVAVVLEVVVEEEGGIQGVGQMLKAGVLTM
jgi:hypothetical protein